MGFSSKVLVVAVVVVGLFVFTAGTAWADTILFEEDFEGDLSAWTGKTGFGGNGSHSGVIVTDPDDPLNDVVTFGSPAIAGDLLTAATFAVVSGETYRISFRHKSPRGGLVGYAAGLPGAHYWFYGVGGSTGLVLTTDNSWHSYSYEFTAPAAATGLSPIRLMFEEWASYSGGPVYFDDIALTHVMTGAAVPEPGTLALMGLGVLGLAYQRRRKMSAKAS